MKRPPRQSLKVAKAVLLPHHPLSDRLRKVLKAVDAVHSPPNLKPLPVVMSASIKGARFIASADTGPYAIELNPKGTHLELSLLHEIGHYVEWQAIPKSAFGPLRLETEPLFSEWFLAISGTDTVQRLAASLEQTSENSFAANQIAYWLLPVELWARSYAQYIASRSDLMILRQQIAAENKGGAGIIHHASYWSRTDFLSVQKAMDALFETLGWEK